MNQDGKVKALKKVIDMLVVPKVNELEPVSGFSIRSVKVGLTSYGERNNEPDFRILVDLTREPNFKRATDGVSHLILNVVEYVDTNSDLTVDFAEWGSYFESIHVHTKSRFRKSTEECIYAITGGHG